MPTVVVAAPRPSEYQGFRQELSWGMALCVPLTYYGFCPPSPYPSLCLSLFIFHVCVTPTQEHHLGWQHVRKGPRTEP